MSERKGKEGVFLKHFWIFFEVKEMTKDKALWLKLKDGGNGEVQKLK